MNKINLTYNEIRALAALGAMAIERQDLAIALLKNNINLKTEDYVHNY